MQRLARRWFGAALWKRVVVALVLGVATGLVMGESVSSIKWIGDLFIRAIKMLVVPLIFFSLVGGVVAVGDVRKLGSLGARAMALFLTTAVVSVTLGMSLATLVRPGDGLTITLPPGTEVPPPPNQSLTEMLIAMVPDNPINAMAQGDILPVIVFAILFGVAMLMTGAEARPLTRGVEAASAVMQRLTVLVMEFTPFGVFALMAWVAGTFGWSALMPLGPRSAPALVERKMDKCLPMSAIAGGQAQAGSRLILFLRDRRMVAANLERACSARDFYSGFYVDKPNADGRLCADRDRILARSGARCEIASFRLLVADD